MLLLVAVLINFEELLRMVGTAAVSAMEENNLAPNEADG
jgi:hypothetical protein